ncbi:hypothetical protein AB0E10_13635 [Streptomyces sp. NPDC048045]|uniref:hypothetical protein n=1 Tax=Streptomyces sp. NPDC048045 TaxID=3154710 RepID=UPI00341F1E1B
MPDTAVTSIQQKYQQQYAADLESNRSRQKDIERQIATLEETLGRLRADEKWLAEQMELVPAHSETTAVPRAEDGAPAPVRPEETSVPEPRQEAHSATVPKKTVKKAAKRAAKRAAKKAPAKKTTATATVTERAAKPAAKKAATVKTTGKGAEPPLGDLLLRVLATNPVEPRTAAEVVTGLEKAFPERARDINTVRNTLERLVAKSRIERTKQGSTVYYTVPQQSGAGMQEADTTPAGEESETVAAQV